jgi:hypothetical protein
VCKILVARHEEKRSLGRHRRRWEDGTRMYSNIREIGWEVVDYFHVAQGKNHCKAFVKTVMNLQVS